MLLPYEQAFNRIRAEYVEMPGMQLTPEQVERLCGVNAAVYATRRRESFEAAALLGVGQLRDLSIDALPHIAALPPVLARRARHIVIENQRVIDGVAALGAGDAAALGALFNASHASMRDDYQTSIPDIDALVACGQADPAVYGARLTGGGFGGAVVMLAHAGRGSGAATRVLAAYEARTGRRGTILLS